MGLQLNIPIVHTNGVVVTSALAPGDLTKLDLKFKKFISEFPEGARKATEKAMVGLILALKDTTKPSKTKREVGQNPEYGAASETEVLRSTRAKLHIFDNYKLKKYGKTGRKAKWLVGEGVLWPYAVRKVRDGVETWKAVLGAITKREANDSPLRLIRRRGLARHQWSVALAKLGKGGVNSTAGMKDFTAVAKSTSPSNIYIDVHDRLKYAGSAFNRAGKNIPATLAERTSSVLDRLLEKAITDALEKAKLKGKTT